MQSIIDHYQMTLHVEGGFYCRTYFSELSSAILYLVPSGVKSRIHRLKSDEIWHFYLGDPFIIIEFEEDGLKETAMGSGLLDNQKVQHIVPANRWFGGYSCGNAGYSLVGCTLAPAFKEQDMELADCASLIKQFPQYRAYILDFFN